MRLAGCPRPHGSDLNPDWRHLADIGQAYGAASAIFSALAVAGVAAGLVYQARALRLARVQAIRTHTGDY